MQSARYVGIQTFLKTSDSVCARFETQGGLLPNVLRYIDSWRSEDGHQCFQIMETNGFNSFDKGTSHWNDLVGPKIIRLAGCT
jgi:hypothetical protein